MLTERITAKQNEEFKNEITNQKKQIKKLTKKNKSKISNINIENSNNNNSNNIIQIIQFGKEDLSVIDNKHFLNMIKNPTITGTKIPEELVKIIHYNNDHPEMHNIYIYIRYK